MRSDFFADYLGLKEQFQDHWSILWSIAPETRRQLIPVVLDAVRADTTGKATAIIERAASSIDISDADAIKALGVLQFIATEWNPVNDTPESFLEDLESLALLPDKDRDEAIGFFLEFLSQLYDDNLRRLTRMFVDSVVPSYLGVTTVVDYRPVISPFFGAGREDRLADYHPEVVNWVPVVLVRIRSDTDPSKFVFQLGEEALDRLIETLQATKKDLQTARSALATAQGDPE